jgi:hypothetical protein
MAINSDLRQQIIEIAQEYFNKQGEPIGRAALASSLGVSKVNINGKLIAAGFSGIGDANQTAVGAKNERKTRDEDKYLIDIALLTRRLRRLPAASDLRLARVENENFPNYDSIRQWASAEKRVELLRSLSDSNSDYTDIAEYLPEDTPQPMPGDESLAVTKLNEESESDENSDEYLPPILMSLPSLAHPTQWTREAWKARNRNVAVEFEKRVRAAFEIIGFEVEDLGQGRGRNPDGRAVDLSAHWAAVIDAKSREETYRLSTDDRPLREYYEQSDKVLRAKGVKNIAIVIVSSSFEPKDIEAAKGLRKLTGASSVVLLEAKALLVIVDSVLRMPLQRRLDYVEHLLGDTQIVDERLVEKAS